MLHDDVISFLLLLQKRNEKKCKLHPKCEHRPFNIMVIVRERTLKRVHDLSFSASTTFSTEASSLES